MRRELSCEWRRAYEAQPVNQIIPGAQNYGDYLSPTDCYIGFKLFGAHLRVESNRERVLSPGQRYLAGCDLQRVTGPQQQRNLFTQWTRMIHVNGELLRPKRQHLLSLIRKRVLHAEHTVRQVSLAGKRAESVSLETEFGV